MTSQTVSLPGTVNAAAPGLKGFDADTVISADIAQQFKQAGYAFCARYLSLSDGQEAGDLSNSEALAILNAGLALVAVQHVPEPGWVPRKSLSNVPAIPNRGYQLIQSNPTTEFGVGIDTDTTQTDSLGNDALWVSVS
jgi:hypothetical protein